MYVVCRQLPDSLSMRERAYAFCIVDGYLFPGVLAVRQGKKRDVYAVQEEQPDPLRRRLFAVLNVKSGNCYLVTVPATVGEVGHCTCSGFGRWKTCKHSDSLCDLVQERALPSLF